MKKIGKFLFVEQCFTDTEEEAIKARNNCENQ